MRLVDETGLDPVYSGSLADSWRQQPASPVYCTDLTRDEILAALDATERARLPKRRDLAIDAIMERVGDSTTTKNCWFALVEAYIEASDIACTHLHPRCFLENMLSVSQPIGGTFSTFWGENRVG
jgi:hypothetical protein